MKVIKLLYLHQPVGLEVDVGGGLVDAYNLSRREDRSGEADQLPLSHREVAPLLLNARVESAVHTSDGRLHAGLAERSPQFSVAFLCLCQIFKTGYSLKPKLF